GKYVVSFSGYVPADHPEFVGLGVLEEAHTSKPELNYRGLVASPSFARIGEKAARYLYPQPREEIRKALPVERVALTNASHHSAPCAWMPNSHAAQTSSRRNS